MPARPHRGLLDEGAQHEVAAVRPAVDGEPPIRPGLVLDPAPGIDHVVDVGVTPLVVVGLAECPPVAGRSPEVDVEERVAGLGQQQAEGRERAVRLPGRAAVRDRRSSERACHRACRSRRTAATACPRVAARRGRSGRPVRRSPRGRARGPRRARPDASRSPGAAGRHPGATPGHRQQPEVLRSGLALPDGGHPGTVRQPADRVPDAGPGRDRGRGAVARREHRAWRLGRSAATALGRLGRAQRADDQVDEPVMDLDVQRVDSRPATAAPRSRSRRRVRRARDRRRSGRCGRDRPASAARPGTSRWHRTRRRARRRRPSAARRRGWPRRPRPAAPHWPRPPGRSAWSTRSSGRSWAAMAIVVPSGDQAKPFTSTPAAVRAVAMGACGSRCGRPRRGTGASMSQTWLQPRRRDRNARRCPSGDQRGSRPPPGLATTSVSRDPSASTIQISPSRT